LFNTKNQETEIPAILKESEYILPNIKEGVLINLFFCGKMDPEEILLANMVLKITNKGVFFVINAENEDQNATILRPKRVEHKNAFAISAYDEREFWHRSIIVEK